MHTPDKWTHEQRAQYLEHAASCTCIMEHACCAPVVGGVCRADVLRAHAAAKAEAKVLQAEALALGLGLPGLCPACGDKPPWADMFGLDEHLTPRRTFEFQVDGYPTHYTTDYVTTAEYSWSSARYPVGPPITTMELRANAVAITCPACGQRLAMNKHRLLITWE